MQHALLPLLARFRTVDPAAAATVDPRDVARLEAELGRPLPFVLKQIWQLWGAGTLGDVELSSPREISDGLALSDRFLDEGLLPCANGPDGELWAVRLARQDDPEVFLALDFPRPLRAAIGTLARASEAAVLRALQRAGRANAADLARLAALDSDGRFAHPAAWASRALAIGA